MFIEDHLTAADLTRTMDMPASPSMGFTAYNVGLRALDGYMMQYINPMLTDLTPPTERETAFVGFHARVHGFVKTGIALTTPEHAQSLSAADRSVIELQIDMELLHQDKIADGVRRLHAFTDAQRLAHARKTIAFYDQHPEFSDDNTADMRKFVPAKESAIDRETIALWGAKKSGAPEVPQHWTSRDLKSRAALLGPTFEKMVVDGYDLRNWLIHSGLTSVAHLTAESYVALCSLALSSIHRGALASMRIVVAELKLANRLTGFPMWQRRLEGFPGTLVADLQLRALGEPQRVTLHL